MHAQPLAHFLSCIDTVTAYIDKLKGIIDEKDAELLAFKDTDNAKAMDTDAPAAEEEDFSPLYKSGEDYEAAAEHKMKAADLKNEGKWEEALEEYNLAVQAAPPSALLYANRATVLLKLEKFKAAERDCDEAIKENPDSAKALRVRGKVLKAMGEWEKSLHDLSASQTIDFDEDTVADLKEVQEKVKEIEHAKVQEKLEKEEKMRKRAEEIKKAQEEAKKGEHRRLLLVRVMEECLAVDSVVAECPEVCQAECPEEWVGLWKCFNRIRNLLRLCRIQRSFLCSPK